MASIETRTAMMNEKKLFEPHEGGWYVYSNFEEVTETDPQTGESRTYWTATATWQQENPES